MEIRDILLIILGIFLLMKVSEGFGNFSELNAYDNKFIENDEPKIKDFKPKKTSELVGYCDEKRDVCYRY